MKEIDHSVLYYLRMVSDSDRQWTRAERLTLIGVIATLSGALAAWLVVPGIREFFGLEEHHNAPIENKYQQETPTPPKSAKKSKQKNLNDSVSEPDSGKSGVESEAHPIRRQLFRIPQMGNSLTIIRQEMLHKTVLSLEFHPAKRQEETSFVSSPSRMSRRSNDEYS